MKDFVDKTCPKCGFQGLKGWHDLDEEEKMVVERLPLNSEFTKQQRKNHSFCLKCGVEVHTENSDTIV